MTRTFLTQIIAVSPVTGVITHYAGPMIESISFDMARDYCNRNGLGYCNVIGEVSSSYEIEYDGGKIIKHQPKYN